MIENFKNKDEKKIIKRDLSCFSFLYLFSEKM